MNIDRSILLAEDDPQIGRLVATLLREMGNTVAWVQDGSSALDYFRAHPVDLIILDLLLPGISGFEVCHRMREENRLTPIIILSAKAEKSDVVVGLEAGADDYLTKPFSTAELIARIHAIFRRIEVDGEAVTGRAPSQPVYRGDLVLYPTERRLMVRGRPVALTAKEFELLLLFSQNPGRTFTRSELLNEVWGPDFGGQEHTVNTHINRLRGKLEADPSHPIFIRTAWGIGYRFADLEELEETCHDTALS